MSNFRGRTAIAGIGQTPYYKRAQSPDSELKLCLRAIVAAAEDAHIDPREIDGFVSYGSERSDGQKLMPALGTRQMRFNALAWTHGGGIPGAIGIAACAVIAGLADVVAVYRSMAELDHVRLRVAVSQNDTAAQYLANGIDSPAQLCALRSQRMLYDGVPRSALKAMSQASYYHANHNPNAMGRDIVLDDELYESSRMISEPFRIFDCSRESDASACVIVVSAERARTLAKKPAYILSVPMGADSGWGSLEENHTPYASSGFIGIAKRMWEESGYRPEDVNVVQCYENFTGLGVAALIDHGFCTYENAGEFFQLENLIAPNGRLPVNTSGGNLAEGFIHGMGLVNEAVRQIRGESTNQVLDANLSLMTGGPGDFAISSALFGSENTI